MNITINAKCKLTPENEAMVEKKLAAPLRLLGDDKETALLEIEIEEAPPEGRSSEPYRLVANLIVGKNVFHAEAVKPTPESAADRARHTLEAEIRRSRGRTRSLLKRGSMAVKKLVHFGR